VNRFVVDTRGLTAFGGRRLRKLLWTLTTLERPFTWALAIATSMLIYWAPVEVLTQWPYAGDFCRWLIAAVPGLRFEPSASPFPQVVQFSVCLAFAGFWLHLALAIVCSTVKPISNAQGLQRVREMGLSISKGLVAGVVCLVLAIAGTRAILSSGDDPGVYIQALLTSRLELAFLFGFSPFLLPFSIVTLVAISLVLFKQRFLRED